MCRSRQRFAIALRPARRCPSVRYFLSRTFQLLDSVQAREDLLAELAAVFDLELLDVAVAQVRERIAAKTWEAVDRNLKKAPKPELVAAQVCRLISASTPAPRVTVGDFFQGKVAPFIFRFLPQRLRVWGLKKYYDI